MYLMSYLMPPTTLMYLMSYLMSICIYHSSDIHTCHRIHHMKTGQKTQHHVKSNNKSKVVFALSTNFLVLVWGPDQEFRFTFYPDLVWFWTNEFIKIPLKFWCCALSSQTTHSIRITIFWFGADHRRWLKRVDENILYLDNIFVNPAVVAWR